MKSALAFLAVLLLTAATLCRADAPKKPVHVKQVSVHLFLIPLGVFSDDVTQMKGFGARNFKPFGSGIPENQRFDSFLIKVRLESGGEQYVKGRIGTIEVRSQKSRQIIERQHIRDLYIGPEGETATAMLIRDHVCEPLLVSVRLAQQRIEQTLSFTCGE